ncbi:cysteine--1-D-myo-inosityl 2-amino-2-deoxy-alpha-D-glucopyranoside ligase [soil metagenome]
MKSWSRPEVPPLVGKGPLPSIFDTSSASVIETRPIALANIYVCGITPYDATHIGHASTYLAFDTLIRLWHDAGYDVSYVQNVTDVDDPLLERAAATGVDWRTMAADQVELFREDMQALALIPPDHFIAVTEAIHPIAEAVERLLTIGIAYRVDEDIYFDIAAAAATSPWQLGQVSGLGREEMLDLFRERGGDPERPGKRDALDPLLWRGPRAGEPRWTTTVGEGRPGWHIECSVIAHEYLEFPLTVNGGGIDLAFPHHEFTAAHTAALTGIDHSLVWSHAALVGYQGEKMSKSLGNLVLVSTLRAGGADARAIRLAILAHHYRESWEWTADDLDAATVRLAEWTRWAAVPREGAAALADELRVALASDLDTPAALALVDARVTNGPSPTPGEVDAITALLGVRL